MYSNLLQMEMFSGSPQFFVVITLKESLFSSCFSLLLDIEQVAWKGS